jgi:hypothetical protein
MSTVYQPESRPEKNGEYFGEQIKLAVDELYKKVNKNKSYDEQGISFYNLENDYLNTFYTIRKIMLQSFGHSISNIDQKPIIKAYRDKYSAENINLKTHRTYKTNLITYSGEIKYERYVLRPETPKDLRLLQKLYNKKVIVPLDEWFRLDNLPFKITPFAMLKIAEIAASQLSYLAAKNVLEKWNNIFISQETVRLVTDTIGNIVYNNDLEKANQCYQKFTDGKLKLPKKNLPYILYIMPDGSMIHTRDKDESGHKWKENKLAVIFSSKDMVLKSKDNGEENYHIKRKEYVNYFGEVDKFQKLLFSSAIKYGYGAYDKTVIISDGATWIAHMKDLLFPDALHILDYWHLCQHIYEFAKIYFRKDETKYISWVSDLKIKLLTGQHNDVIDEIEAKETKLLTSSLRGYNKDEKNSIGKLSKYMKKNINSIDYASYRSQGLYIGSGHIESGNKSVAQERLKRPGMMWNIDSAQNLLSLRAKLKSNLWNSDVFDIVLKNYNMI